MKKIWLGLALASVSATAIAADMPTKAPILKAPAAMVYDWTGFYVGVNTGIGVGRNLTDVTRTNGFVLPSIPDPKSHLGPLGMIGGAQAGFNVQFRSLVLGVEADIQAANMRDDLTCVMGCTGAFATSVVRFDQQLGWLATARARIGLAHGPALSYITGGFATGGVQTTVTDSAPSAATLTTNQTRNGWTLGSGKEASAGGNWTAKIEYLYVDLGRQTGNYTQFVGFFGIGNVPRTVTSDIREHIFRAGLNYRFGNNAGFTEPLANWAGFYLGGNLGSGVARDLSTMTQTFPGPGTLLVDRFNLMPQGYIGGLQAGYNFQTGSVVYGVEADIQMSNMIDDKACQNACQIVNVGPLVRQTFDQRLGWLGTARARVGHSVGATLFYLTAGAAFGEIKTSVVDSNVGPLAITMKQNNLGFTVGGGIETPFDLFGLLGKNWTTKTEYLYVDLGSASSSYAVPGGSTNFFTTQVREHIFRSGLNFHFAPVAN